MRRAKHRYASDVRKMLSIDLDIDDAGEEKIRRAAAESAMAEVRAAADSQFGVRFSVREQGWTMVFMIESSFGFCSMRLADRSDYRDWREDRRRGREPTSRDDLSIDLPPIDRITAGDIESAIGVFIVQDVQDQ